MKFDPRLVTTKAELRAAVAELRAARRTIGLVPTMGALHRGHTSLVEASRARCTATVATIFVNPTQFGPNEDYARYPRTLEADLAMLSAAGADLVFAPSRDEVYGPRHSTYCIVERASEPLEGRVRPTHFRGVATVVLKLLNLVTPQVAFFGQKDYQQTLVIRRMVEDLDVPVEIVVCATIREPDGLAMSSRNAYLSADERRRATALYRTLRLGQDLFDQATMKPQAIVDEMRAVIEAEGEVEIDYLVLADPESLEPVRELQRDTVALVAARVGKTRLIDNMIYSRRMKAEG